MKRDLQSPTSAPPPPTPMPSVHECPCSTFGPGPHDPGARHPNPKACEHSERELVEAWAEAEAAIARFAPSCRVWIRGLASGYAAGIDFPEFRDGQFVRSEHETPAAALRALTARLASKEGDAA